MITKFKLYEHIDWETFNIRCTWCYALLYDDGEGFEYNDEDNEVCPKCGEGGHLMDINPEIVFDGDFSDYVDNNLPKSGIKIEDYNGDIIKYYQDAYPEYFTAKKYNI